MRAWQEGLGLVPLVEGGWAGLPAAWLQKHGQRVADLLAAREDDGRLARHALPALGALCDELEHPPPPGLDRLRAARRRVSNGCPTRRLPSDLTATLRAYQHQGVDWLAFLRGAGLGGILADDMGLGKTLQAMCVACARPRDARRLPDERPLQLGRASSRAFVRACASPSITGRARSFDATADVTLTTYAILRLDAKALAARSFGARRARRGAGDQEPGQPDGARGVRAARRLPPGADAARPSRTASKSCGA